VLDAGDVWRLSAEGDTPGHFALHRKSVIPLERCLLERGRLCSRGRGVGYLISGEEPMRRPYTI
jgi:hypothetical protein